MSRDSILKMRRQKDAFFETSPQSPLTDEQKESFEGLKYYDYNPALDLTVDVMVFPDEDYAQVFTTKDTIRNYRRYGEFKFSVEGEEARLTIYAASHGFFLPFVDANAGTETYPAGRYLEPEQLVDGRFHVDFNQAYNPYCAYNDRWECPITPAENRLKVPIRAGEKIG
jgi:uncharacterized protein (DUF1684 family)